ncbi:hypothetical protein CARUB_v10022287mg [Capsella rubella]|uniref:Neprosin PEP catalytic domain-containing protein n=1 Tax=Capsella rubella TaxID=81985 RepID=R0I9P6_9BRAS|nr:uncharacterized protein LOC17894630 [Capsella rubella]EOA33263.1 hypothetical protein CARUB_v10022287mg [Capsella rubella]
MSTKFRMTFLMMFLHLLFSTTLIHSDQNMVPLKTFKISEKVIYDCIDIYKQPGLDHPLLKDHTIQMKPSVSRLELKNQTLNNKTYKTKMRCPDGTVPILKTSKEYINNTQLFTEKYFHPLSGDSPGTHIAGIRSREDIYRGVEAWFSLHNLKVERDQASYSQIYIGSGSNNQVNFIQAGWMINPSLVGDTKHWSYGYWKGKDGKECYNTACPGFVQISREVPIAQPLDQPWEVLLHYSIHQDKQSGNWWLTKLIPKVPNINIGYWPKELFNLMDNGANMVRVGGVVQASRKGLSPPMGNSLFPNKDSRESAHFTNIKVMDINYEQRGIDFFSTQKLLDSPKCYGLRTGNVKLLDFFINYGGPGGNSCGV